MTTGPGRPSSELPAYATALGYGGLLPFIACGLSMLLLPDAGMRHVAGRVLVGYGAVILSFLGGVHWGLVLRGPSPRAGACWRSGCCPRSSGG